MNPIDPLSAGTICLSDAPATTENHLPAADESTPDVFEETLNDESETNPFEDFFGEDFEKPSDTHISPMFNRGPSQPPPINPLPVLEPQLAVAKHENPWIQDKLDQYVMVKLDPNNLAPTGSMILTTGANEIENAGNTFDIAMRSENDAFQFSDDCNQESPRDDPGAMVEILSQTWAEAVNEATQVQDYMALGHAVLEISSAFDTSDERYDGSDQFAVECTDHAFGIGSSEIDSRAQLHGKSEVKSNQKVSAAVSNLKCTLRAPTQDFDKLIKKCFGKPAPGSAKSQVKAHAIKNGKIQAGDAGLRQARRRLQKELGTKVDLCVLKSGDTLKNKAIYEDSAIDTQQMEKVDILYCKIFIDTDVPDETVLEKISTITAGIIDQWTVYADWSEIDFVDNDDFDEHKRNQKPDGFLFYRYYIEMSPNEHVAAPDYIQHVADLMEKMWQEGWKAVAACDFEDKLPQKGGYHQNGV